MKRTKLLKAITTPVIITNQEQFQADEQGTLPRTVGRGEKLMTATRIG